MKFRGMGGMLEARVTSRKRSSFFMLSAPWQGTPAKARLVVESMQARKHGSEQPCRLQDKKKPHFLLD